MSLYRNIHAKRKRIKAGSGEKMRKKGSKGAPTAKNFAQAKRKNNMGSLGKILMIYSERRSL